MKGPKFISALLLSISIIDWKHEFVFFISVANSHRRREAWPLGEDAGNSGTPTKSIGQDNPNPNARPSSDEGGILTAIPTDEIRRSIVGASDPMSLYPPNKIHATCDICGAGIARYDGYRHAPIGVKRVVCSTCQSSLGLPLREADVYAEYRD